MKKKVKEYYLNDDGQLVDSLSNNQPEPKQEVKENITEEKPYYQSQDDLNQTQRQEPVYQNVQYVQKQENVYQTHYVTQPTEKVNYTTIVKEETQEPLKEEIKEVERRQFKINARPEVLKKKEYNQHPELVNNPFFYDYNPTTEEEIHTIEDYYILRKNKYYNFGGLVRTNKMWMSKKKRILKKQLKIWYDEFEKRLDDINTFGSSQFQSSEKKIGNSLNILFAFLSTLALIGSIIVLNGKVWVISTPTYPWAKVAYFGCILASIFVLLASHLINRSSKSIKKMHLQNKNEYNKRKDEVEKNFQKKYKQTYNYYVKGLKKKFKKEVLLLDKTAIGETNIKAIETVITENTKKLQSASRKEKLINVCKFFIKFISI